MILKDKVVVITGGSKGFGKALAEAFLQEGAKVSICSPNKDEVKKVAEELGAFGIYADVTKEKDLTKLVEQTLKQYGGLDIWINNAGISMGHMSVEKVDIKKAHKVMEVNFFGTFYGSRLAMKYFKKQKYGTIVNIISARALVPSPISSIYSSSKWAVRGFTELLRMVLVSENISVIAVYPVGMKTDFFGKTKPLDYKKYMEPEFVAKKIIQNLKLNKPEEEIIIKREEI